MACSLALAADSLAGAAVVHARVREREAWPRLDAIAVRTAMPQPRRHAVELHGQGLQLVAGGELDRRVEAALRQAPLVGVTRYGLRPGRPTGKRRARSRSIASPERAARRSRNSQGSCPAWRAWKR